MARYLIQLGRETGQGRHWNRALAMLDAILGRLLPLGLAHAPVVRARATHRDSTSTAAAGVWGLHAMLIETMLDLAGLDYDALDRRLTLGTGPAQRLAAHRAEPDIRLRRGLLSTRSPDRRARSTSSA